ncbi:MAG: sensor histidine kinase [Clostridia bacterium]|nr:sensor histidine kinase [Clostridia bacterium]
MKTRATENLLLKATAVFLFFFAIIGLELSILGIVSCEALGIYDVQWLGEDLPDAVTLHTLLITWKSRLPYTAFLSATITAVTLVYLCCAAGHQPEKPGITFNLQDRIPYDLYLILIFGAIWLIGAMGILIADEGRHIGNLYFHIVAYALLGGSLALVLLALLLTTVTRLKAGRMWRNTLVWRTSVLCFRLLTACVKGLLTVFCLFRIEWRVLLISSLYGLLLSLLLLEGASDGLAFLLAVGLLLGGITALCLLSNRLHILFEDAHALAAGNLSHSIDTDRLFGDLRRHGEDLNSIADGLNIAVEQRLRSERLKTELITNVSHDIKTPLTSIINYVDLLQKEPLEGKAREYTQTLERHTNRLKKLTEDLVEASKAATGNIKVELLPMDVCELLHQAVGEYSERLAASSIEPIVILPADAPYILADGHLIWRVLENLLSNAAKYAQPGTRLYISLLEEEKNISLEMKNISHVPLGITPDELMERFVRGDSSRHTEGSGLGLNIAKSLTELQGAAFDLSIDGDLFKVTLTFDRLTYGHKATNME